MKKSLLFILLMGCVLSLNAQKKVIYITFQKTMDASATTVTNDPIIQVLKADPNLSVTVLALTTVTATEVIADLGTYDVIIVQEPFSSSAAVLTSAGTLALKTMPKPFIYNKTYALRTGKALATSTAAAADIAALSITVGATALTNDLFKACTIGASNEIVLFAAGMTDIGAAGTKSLNYTTGNVISGASTLLAQPTGVTTAAVAINDIPAGTTIDSETLTNRMITMDMNTGAICGAAGKNITDDCLTIWRNAVYILTGLPVPSTKATLPTGLNNHLFSSTFSFDGKVVRNTNSEVLNVYNVTGKLVSTSNKDIDMINLAKGVYFVKGQNNTLKVSLR